MSSIVDTKDSKGLVIAMLAAVLSLIVYIYNANLESRKVQDDKIIQLVKDEGRQINDTMKEFKNDIKDIKTQQQAMSIDIGVLKAVRGLSTTKESN